MTPSAAVILGGTSLTGGRGRIQETIIGVLMMAVISNGLTLMGTITGSSLLRAE